MDEHFPDCPETNLDNQVTPLNDFVAAAIESLA